MGMGIPREQLGSAFVKLRYALPIGWNGNTQPCIPQQDPHPNRRAFELSIIKSLYSYLPQDERVNPLKPIAVAGNFPLYEQYGLSWAIPYLPQFVASFVDTEVKKLLFSLNRTIDKVKAYKSLFSRDLPAPPEEEDWQRDAVFARNRIDGPNPLLLSRVNDATQLSQMIEISEAQFQSVMGTSLAAELAAGNIFVADYRLLQKSLLPPTAHGRDTRWREKYLPAPVALFCQRPGYDPFCDLAPVAISIDQKNAAPPNPLYLRSQDPAWLIAKSFVETAEFNLQAMSSHIYRHHYVAEPFAMTTKRQLSPAHPVYVLLEPHIAYTLAVNGSAFDLLKKPGSVFDEIYSGELSETRQIMIESHLVWSWPDLALEADLHHRGVENAPTEYPYRDDARLWLQPIKEFVTDYLKLYYHKLEDIQSDWELQAWARELMAPEGGNLRQLFPNNQLVSVTDLASVLAQFLFTAGPAHSSVHYPQTDYFTYVPAFPGAAFQPPPGDGEPATLDRWTSTLPPVHVGADQFMNNQIANYRYDKFGYYGRYPLSRVKAAQPAIAKLQQSLRDVEQTIETRNKTRARPYKYLLPSLVTNSINI
jgi:arachidonate 15-lipoxygenase